jgi:hypothetical protein
MAEPWLHDDASIEVDVDSLADFAARVEGEASKNVQPSFNEGVMPAMGVMPMFGGGGLKEGQFYGTLYSRQLTALQMMFQDLTLGFQSLSMAARSIGNEYSSGDAMSSATVSDVFNMFYPASDDPRSLQALLAEAERKADEAGQGGNGTANSGPDNPANAGPDNPAGSGDGSEPPSSASENGPQVIAEGKPGELVIPADNEGMADTPDGPTMPETNEVILAPGPIDGSAPSSGTVA